MKMETFEEWWNRVGRFYDPDTEDVPWFDKRKELAELAFRSGWQSVTGKIELGDESAWLLEKQNKGANWFIGVIDGLLDWTTDPNKALRLCRREDAEAIATICEDAERISEHLWPEPQRREQRSTRSSERKGKD
jgi:hypothetical protein